MAIAHESSTLARTTAAVNTLTTSFTVTSANLLVVCTSIRSATDANRVVTGITWNGTALTKVREDQNDAIDCGTGIWYLASPAAGTFNVVTTCTGSINNNLTHSILGLTGVDTASPVDTTGNTNTTTSATGLTVAVTTTTANSWVVSSTYAKVDAGITINGTNEVSRTNSIGGGGTDTSASTTMPTTTTGVYTVSWTSGATDQSITSAVAFKEGAGGGGGAVVVKQLAALGVG